VWIYNEKNIYQKNYFINVVIFKIMFSQWFWSKTILLCTPTVNVPTDISNFLNKLDHLSCCPTFTIRDSFLLHENLLIVTVLGTIATISAHGVFFGPKARALLASPYDRNLDVLNSFSLTCGLPPWKVESARYAQVTIWQCDIMTKDKSIKK